MEIGDLNFATRLRALLEDIARRIINEVNPPPRYGRAIRFNRFTGTCDVLLQGDPEPVRCSMVTGVQPSYSDEGIGVGNGDVVQVMGKPGSYRITEVMSVNNFSIHQNLYHPTIWTGDFLHTPALLYDSITSGLPAVGATWHIGRWNNETSFVSDAQGYIEVELQWTFFTANTKKYKFAIRPNSTNGNWVKLAPIIDSGPLQDNACGLEILVDTLGFELRIRRMAQGAGFAPAGWDVRLEIWLDHVYKVPNSALGAQSTTEPTKFFGCQQDVKIDKGPFIAPMYALPRILQANLMGGGTITWDGSTLGWSEAFRIPGIGKSFSSKSGYFEITQPANGTSIPVYSNNAVSSVSATTAGIPISGDRVLYYEPPYGDVFNSVATCFRLVDMVDAEFNTPSHWILVAARTSLSGSPSLKLGTGEEYDHWRTLSFSNSWVNYGTPFSTAGYKFRDGREVEFRGLVKDGTVNATIFTLPTAYRPLQQKLLLTNINNAFGRLGIFTDGTVKQENAVSNAFVTLDGISYSIS